MRRLCYIIMGIIVIVCAACSSDDTMQQPQSGFFLTLTDDAAVVTRATPAQLGAPVAASCMVKIVNDKTGGTMYNGAYAPYVSVPAGSYTLAAHYGTDVELGINTPYYYGEAHAVIDAANLTPAVNIPCRVANSLLSVRYLDREGNVSTSRFDDMFSSYCVRVETARYSVSLEDESQSAYFRSGTMPRICFAATLAGSGREVEYEISGAGIPAALNAAEHLVLNLSLQLSPSGVVLEVAKAQVEHITVSETIPLDWLPAPKMSAYTGEAAFMRYEDEEAPTNLAYTLTTAGVVQEVELTINSTDSRLATLNGKHLLSLMKQAERKLLEDMGFAVPEIGVAYSGMEFDLNAFAANLRTNDGAITHNSVGVRVKANNRWTGDVPQAFDVEVRRLRFTLPQQAAGNAWSHTLYIDPVKATDIVAGEGVDVNEVLSSLYYEVSADGGNTWTPVATTPSGTMLSAPLNSSTTYQLRASYKAAPVHSNTATQAMESQAEVPNGDFENMHITYNNVTIDQGSKYTRTKWPGADEGQNTQTFTVQEPTGWGSTNAKTSNLSASTVNSWFCPLSVFNTTIEFQTNEAKIAGLGGNTIHPANYCEQTAQHGSNAMVVRNVAYSANGTVPDTYKNTAATPGNSYYSKNTPNISHTAAGKLFIGSYTFSGGTETFNEGVGFASRPTALNGYYKYDTSKGSATDQGRVTVTLLNGSTTIATGTANLSAAGSYTQFTIPLNYTSTTTKATSLRIMIASGQSDNVATTKIAEYIQEAYGNVLTVDNLTFTYSR